MSEINVPPPSPAGKKQVERSASYPAIKLEDALSFGNEIYANFPGSPSFTRPDVSAVLGSNDIHRQIAACVQYGLLLRDKDKYKIAERHKIISKTHLSEKEKRKCLLEAFGSPKLYSEIIEKHDGNVIPVELKTHLVRFHRIAEKVAEEVAETFKENARYVGAANEHGILNYKEAFAKISDDSLQYAEVITEKNGQKDPSSKPDFIQIEENGNKHSPPANKLPPPPLPEHSESEQIKIPLTDKKVAFLSYPIAINKRDIEIMRAQISLLELLVE
jgi:hypothetical protein